MKILLIEDDRAGRELGEFNLTRAGYEVDLASSGEEGIARFDPSHHRLVLTDLRMAKVSGLDVLRAVKTRSPETPVIVMTAYGSVDVAVEAMKVGAFDFIGKPFHREHLLLTVARALEAQRLEQEVRELRAAASGVERPIVVAGEKMRQLLAMVDRVARADASVLILGESGTGKELVARRIHGRSKRAPGPFVAINCASVPETLLESELFGHEKGAFTGAAKARLGRFRQAEGGTLFLDEIGELPLVLQGKLLRVLEERLVDVLGRDEPVPVDVRIVAATNRDLAKRVADGTFRADLLYRLDVVSCVVPSLRERREEIPSLVRHFVERFADGRDLLIPDAVLDEFCRRDWPGNVRQLENACERLVILCSGDSLRVDDLPPREPNLEVTLAPTSVGNESVGLDSWPPLPEEGLGLVDLEKQVIVRVLAKKKGNVSQAAQYLRVPRHILVYRMEKYGITRS
jgi:two-component system NtrC family response regulator